MPPNVMHLHQTSNSTSSLGIPSTLRVPQPCACGRFPTANVALFASPAQPVRRPQRQCSLRVASTSLDDLNLFQGGSAMPSTSGSSGREAAVKLEDVSLNSEAGFDYAPLRDALAEADFQKADDITRAALIQLAGPGAVKRNWVYFTEVKFISVADLQTIDALWSAASGGNFGYRIQREVWVQQSKYWTRFFKKIDWTHGRDNNYRKWPQEFTYSLDAVKGHLPLTNALRGTQLFEAIMEHPAFARENDNGTGGQPDWLT